MMRCALLALQKLFSLVIPTFAGGVNDVEDRLRREKSHRGGGTSNCTPNKVRSGILDSHKIDQKVLVGKIGRICSDKEARRTSDDVAQGGVVLGVFVGGFLNVGQKSAEDGTTGTKTDKKSQSAAHPGAGKDPSKAQVSSL